MIFAVCPYCHWKQKTNARRSVKCHKCEKAYLLRPKGKPWRIIDSRLGGTDPILPLFQRKKSL